MKSLKNNLGQTSVEYILLIVVIVSVGTSVFKLIEKKFLDGPGSFQQKFLGNFAETFGGNNGGFQGQFKHFIIRR